MMLLLKLAYLALFIYFFLYILRIFLSFIKAGQNQVTLFLCRITDPVILFFKRLLPLKTGNYDISSLMPIIIMFFMLKFMSDINKGYNISSNYLIYFLFFLADNLLLIICVFIMIITFVILVTERSYHYSNQMIILFKSIINPVIIILRKIFRTGFLNSEKRYYILLLIITAVVFFAGHYFLKNMINIYEKKLIAEIIKESINL